MKKNKNLILLTALLLSLAAITIIAFISLITIDFFSQDSTLHGLLTAYALIINLPLAILFSTLSLKFVKKYNSQDNKNTKKLLSYTALFTIGISMLNLVPGAFFMFNDPEQDTPKAEALDAARKEISSYYRAKGTLPERKLLSISDDESIKYIKINAIAGIYELCTQYRFDTRSDYGGLPEAFSNGGVITNEFDQDGVFLIHKKGDQCYKLEVPKGVL